MHASPPWLARRQGGSGGLGHSVSESECSRATGESADRSGAARQLWSCCHTLELAYQHVSGSQLPYSPLPFYSRRLRVSICRSLCHSYPVPPSFPPSLPPSLCRSVSLFFPLHLAALYVSAAAFLCSLQCVGTHGDAGGEGGERREEEGGSGRRGFRKEREGEKENEVKTEE